MYTTSMLLLVFFVLAHGQAPSTAETPMTTTETKPAVTTKTTAAPTTTATTGKHPSRKVHHIWPQIPQRSDAPPGTTEETFLETLENLPVYYWIGIGVTVVAILVIILLLCICCCPCLACCLIC